MWPGGLQDFGAMMGSGGGGSFVGGVTETKSSSVKKEEKKEEAPAEVKEVIYSLIYFYFEREPLLILN